MGNASRHGGRWPVSSLVPAMVGVSLTFTLIRTYIIDGSL